MTWLVWFKKKTFPKRFPEGEALIHLGTHHSQIFKGKVMLLEFVLSPPSLGPWTAVL